MSKEYIWQGLEDGGHNYLKCVDCKKSIADVWVTKPDQSVEFKYVALCPFCGSQSDVLKIKGFVHIGSVEPTENQNGTRLKNFVTEKDLVIIHTNKE